MASLPPSAPLDWPAIVMFAGWAAMGMAAIGYLMT